VSPVQAHPAVDLREAPLAELRAIDLRAPDRDLWADELALWDRLVASWAGLDDAAWHLPGAAPSDAGGPDWSLAEHVGHLSAWQTLAVDYTRTAIDTGRWPSDDDFDGGDFDQFNEHLRDPWQTLPRDEILARLHASRIALLAEAGRLTPEQIRDDAAWGWVYLTLHGHYLDHLAIIEPWAEALRLRQIDGDPFVEDPRTEDQDGFVAADDAVQRELEALLASIPAEQWTSVEVTPGWTLQDHLGHLADWADEGARAIDVYHDEAIWLSDPDEGVDAWNEAHVAATRGETVGTTLARLSAGRERLHAATRTLALDEFRAPDGWSWAYDCAYGHVRKHIALIGPWAAATRPSANLAGDRTTHGH
jgi:DinB superfamily/Mycothiol maleylpyruvate isomerase N-terminal domain